MSSLVRRGLLERPDALSVTEEVACYYCPNCLFEVPTASVRGEKNRCVGGAGSAGCATFASRLCWTC